MKGKRPQGRPRLFHPRRDLSPTHGRTLTDRFGGQWVAPTRGRGEPGSWVLVGTDYWLRWHSPAMEQFGPFVVS